MREINFKTIQDINHEVYEKWKDKLHKKQYVAPIMRDSALEQMNDPDLNDYEKKRLQNIIDSGVLDAMEEVVDEEAYKEFDKELTDRIQHAIDTGILPKPSKTPLTEKGLKRIWKKMKK
jgi:hypothetical protein